MKQSACGCAGVFSALCAVELYATVFEKANALNKLEAFASLNGAAFYGLPPPTRHVTLAREQWEIPSSIPFGDTDVVPFNAG